MPCAHRQEAVCTQGGVPVRKSYSVFLLGVLGGTIWLLAQGRGLPGMLGLSSNSEGPSGQVPVSIPAAGGRDVIRVASFNIQVFGAKKLSDPVAVDILTRIVRQFDLVAIQEIRSVEDDVLPRFIEMLNADGRKYEFVIGPRLGRSSSKEQYAFVFDQETIEVNRSQLYTINDPDDVLHREPLVGWFRARVAPAEQAFTFTLINIHTDPDEVDSEINVLDDVFRAVRSDGRQEDDTILLGDFNADEQHFGQLAIVPNLHAVIPANVATNTAGTKSYDNIVFDRLATTEYTGRAGVFDFLHDGFNLSLEVAKTVSDHKPVWAEFSIYEGDSGGRVAALPR
jgi:endonuclease/exonuclease/phosphatase family metal-dependent hydrolase